MGQNSILGTIRSKIVDGQFRPGERLPNRTALEQRFRCSSHTVQRAMTQLIRDGFIVPRGRAGTFVSDTPPHTHRIGLVFPIHLDAEHGGTWARLWSTLDRQAARLRREGGLDLVSYYEVLEHADTEDWRRLQNDLAAHRLAGLILASPNHLPNAADLMARVPCAGFQVESFMVPGLPSVNLDQAQMIGEAMRHLAGKNCRRIAVLANDQSHGRWMQTIQDSAEDHGMITLPKWILGVNPSKAHWTANCVHAMLHRGQDEYPDALFVADDALVDAALAGLLDLGLRPGRDIEMVAHANFPLETPSPWPIARVGFDINEVLDTFLNLLEQQRNGTLESKEATVFSATVRREEQEKGEQTNQAPRTQEPDNTTGCPPLRASQTNKEKET